MIKSYVLISMCCSFQKRTTEDSDSPHKSYCCYKVTVVLHSGISQSIPIQSVRMHCDNPRCCNSSGRICSLLPVMYQLLPSAFQDKLSVSLLLVFLMMPLVLNSAFTLRDSYRLHYQVPNSCPQRPG